MLVANMILSTICDSYLLLLLFVLSNQTINLEYQLNFPNFGAETSSSLTILFPGKILLTTSTIMVQVSADIIEC